MNTIKVNIKKPLYGSFCYIRSSIVEEAIKIGANLEITIPQGTSIMRPKDWKKDCKVMQKVFKFENSPMTLYGNYVELPENPGKVLEATLENKQGVLFNNL